MGSVWVVTGPIGAGKSTVARLFAESGAAVLDADAMAHRLLARHEEIHSGLRRLFGEEVFDADGRPVRQRISDQVFADPSLLAQLEALTHPFVLEELGEKAAEWCASGHGLLLMEVVLWFQQDTTPFPVDGTLLVWAPRERLIERVSARSGVAAAEVERRLHAQGDWDQWWGLADRVLNSDCELPELARRVRQLIPAMTGSDDESRP